MMKTVDWKDVGIRALKTFIQAAVSIAVANLAGVDFIEGENLQNALIGIAISAGAAGVSAVWNAVLSPLLNTISGGNDHEVQ
jgi:Na+/H+-dicarboxylate symporter